jgi:hypothetical protein
MENVVSPQKQTNYSFKLLFDISEIKKYSEEYITKVKPEILKEENELLELRPEIIDRGYLKKCELQKAGVWKSPRSKPKIESNDPDFIREVTKIAFSTYNERLKIEVLTLLKGVGWPTASVLLHLFDKELYPIIDFRALESLQCHVENDNYDFEFWSSYTAATRNLAKSANVDMRTLDRALWTHLK